eukprot:scaffold637270_cov22-Prasinocladus_malaysianus.AAC.1
MRGCMSHSYQQQYISMFAYDSKNCWSHHTHVDRDSKLAKYLRGDFSSYCCTVMLVVKGPGRLCLHEKIFP